MVVVQLMVPPNEKEKRTEEGGASGQPKSKNGDGDD